MMQSVVTRVPAETMIELPEGLRYQPQACPEDLEPAQKWEVAKANRRRLDEVDERQREAGEVIGRCVVIEEGDAVDYFYQVVRLAPEGATLAYCEQVAGCFPHPHYLLGERATIPRYKVERLLERKDRGDLEDLEDLRD